MALTFTSDSLRLTGFVRDEFRQPEGDLSMVLPNINVDTNSFKIQTASRTNNAGVYRAYDTPATYISKPGYTSVTGLLPPISMADNISEAERQDIRSAVLAGDISESVFNYLLDRAAEVGRYVRNRIEKARGEALSTGSLAISENGLIVTHDFGVPAGNLAFTAGTAWATHATAAPIDDLFGVVEDAADNGRTLRHAWMSWSAYSDLLQNASLIGTVPASQGTPQMLDQNQLAARIQAHTGLELHLYNKTIDGSPVIAADKVILTPDPDPEQFGATEFGVTSAQLAMGIDFNAGEPNVVGYFDESANPVTVDTVVEALAMPVIKDPEALYVLDVAP